MMLAAVQFSRSAKSGGGRSAATGLSKLNSAERPRWDAQVRSTFLVPAYLAQSAAGSRPGRRCASRRCPRVGTGPPKKEVNPPQLPLPVTFFGLPPVTGPTFDGCLPEG